jgi:hypothetical protein
VTAQPEASPRAPDLVGLVQSFGLFSAAAVVDRYAQIVDRVISRDALTPPRPRSDDGADGRLVDGALRAAEVWTRLLDVTTTLVLDAARPDATIETFVLPPAAPGRTSEASLWLHNTTPSPVPDLALRGTGLSSSSGRGIPVDAVSLLPDRVRLLAAGTSVQVRLRVLVPAGQPPGRYHGLVMLSATASEPVALRLDVHAPGAMGP